MASQWLIADDRSQENVQKSKYEDLFVFGYGCKLFRDDEQAKLVDSGKYLIPWMGDERLMIDRYDGRGHLFDLTPYDADIQKGEQEGLSEEEKRLEAIYDEERYLELHTDLTEKSMYEEEEWKRYYESLSEGYKAVGFSYDYNGQQVPYTEPVVKQEDPEEQPFVPPQELQVPTGMKIPETNKEAAVIEKTANFIATHGLQMEIMMKTKQANNPKFMFMHFEDTLHPFYKHVIKMIKSGKYKPKVEEKAKEEEHGEEHGEGDGQHSYLHPALLQTNRASPTPEVYKPVQMPKISIHETSYGQLLKSLSKVNQEVAERMKPKEVKREIKTEPAEASGLPACMAQPVYSASMSTHNGMPPPPGIEPVTLPQSTENGDTDVKLEPGTENSLAMDHSHLAHIVPPPPDAQPVVDRMAMYVAKNGPEFEIVVKSKKDTRFEFLLPHHIHYAYYDFKKQLFIKELEREKSENAKNKQENETEEGTEEKEDKDKSSSGAGIKFKVKVKGKEQEVVTLEKKKVFENESSEEDSENGESSERERVPKSGTSTPIADRRHKSEAKSDIDPSTAEKKLAEQRMRDRIAASAREKLGQVDKEKQLQAERKKRAAMFINMLKGSNADGGGTQTNDKASLPEVLTSQTSSRANTPASSERSSSSRQKSKSKRKHKDKRRSDSRSRSRDRSRSRSRSKSRSKKKKRKRSPTPPSAYAVVRRSPLRFPPPPPPRYQSHDRSPSNSRFSKYRSKSRSPGRSKSKKKKRSRSKSPRSKEGKVKDSKSHSKTKKKKKKRSRSKSRSPSRKSSRTKSPPSDIKKVDSQASIQSVPSSERLPSPVTMETTESELEEGETRETTDTEDNVVKENNEQRSPSSMNDRSKHSRSRSRSRSKSRSHSRSHSRSRSRSRESVKSARNGKSPLTSRHSSISRHSSRSRQRSPSIARSHSKSRSRSRSRSTSRHSSASSHHSSKDRKSRSRSRSKSLTPPKLSRQQSPVSPRKRTSVSPEGESGSRVAIPSTPASPDKEEDSDSCASGTSTPKPSAVLAPKKNVSQYMLNRVRAIIKASREAVLKEDMPFLDDS